MLTVPCAYIGSLVFHIARHMLLFEQLCCQATERGLPSTTLAECLQEFSQPSVTKLDSICAFGKRAHQAIVGPLDHDCAECTRGYTLLGGLVDRSLVLATILSGHPNQTIADMDGLDIPPEALTRALRFTLEALAAMRESEST